MKDINKLFLEGRLTRDLTERDLRGTGEQSVLKLPIASNRAVREGDGWGEEAGFFVIPVFGEQAQRLYGMLRKGSHVLIEGSLRYKSWIDSAGQKRSEVRPVANYVKLLSPRNAEPPQSDREEPREFEDDDIPPF